MIRYLSYSNCLNKGINVYQALSRNSNSISLGIVGLANVGKSTFFQAVTKTQLGNPANYPFATIEPEYSKIVVESQRLDKLQRIYNSKRKVNTDLKIVDIAGLTKNASSGEGLGNKFLSNIQQVDGIFQMVRGFIDDEIIHIEENKVDPIRDLVIVMDELILKDLEFIENGIDKLSKTLKKPNQQKQKLNKELILLNELQDFLYEGRKLSNFQFKDVESVEIIKKYNFLTIKPTIYLLNVNQQDYISNKNQFKKEIEVWLLENCPNDKLILVSAKYENEALTNPDSQQFSNLPLIVEEMRRSLSLISYFTCGEQEVREWSIKDGTTAADAAGLIHNDLKETFQLAQVHKYNDIEKLNSIQESKVKQYKYGKSHIVEDGDIILFKAGKGNK